MGDKNIKRIIVNVEFKIGLESFSKNYNFLMNVNALFSIFSITQVMEGMRMFILEKIEYIKSISSEGWQDVSSFNIKKLGQIGECLELYIKETIKYILDLDDIYTKYLNEEIFSGVNLYFYVDIRKMKDINIEELYLMKKELILEEY